MDHESPRPIPDVFEALWAVDPGLRREEFVRLCGDDPELWAEVQSLIRHAEAAEADGFLPTPRPVADGGTRAATENVLAAGARVGHYELLRRLGRGGMGTVYLARRVEPYEQPVALKVIRADLDGLLRERFLAERQLLARLEHPNIVRLLDGGETDGGDPFLVMEYVDGRPLDAYCDGARLTVRDKARLMLAVARAVAYAHAEEVLHRDLKPANILVTDAGVPKVTDFGLARSLHRGDGASTTHRGLLGTPGFMSPEQVRGGPHLTDPAIDCYGLGATLYALLTGRPPFRGETTIDTYHQVMTEEPLPPGRLLKGLPKDLDTLCLRCLEKDPARRYPSVAALADDLEAFLEGRPIAARPVGPAERGWRWCRRNPALATSLTMLAAVILSALVGMTWLWSVARAERDRAEANLGRVVDTLNRWYTGIASRPELQRSDLAPFRRELLENARAALERLGREVGPNPRLRREHIRATITAARISEPIVGTVSACQAARVALEEADRWLAEDPGSPDRRDVWLATAQHVLVLEIDPARADLLYRRAESLLERLDDATDEDRLRHFRQRLTNAYNIAVRRHGGGRAEEARTLFRHVTELGEDAIAAGRALDPDVQITAAAYSHLCDLEAQAGRRDEAYQAVLRSHDLLKGRLTGPTLQHGPLLDYRVACAQLEGYLSDWGRNAESLARARELCETLETAFAAKRPEYEKLRVGVLLLAAYERVISKLRTATVAAPPGTPAGSAAGPDECEAMSRRALDLAEALRVFYPGDAEVDYAGATACDALQRRLRARGAPGDEADRLLERARDFLRSGLKKQPDDHRQRELQACEEALARLRARPES